LLSAADVIESIMTTLSTVTIVASNLRVVFNMVFCRYCHERLPNVEALFCPFCGKKNPIPNIITSTIGFFAAAIFVTTLFYFIIIIIYYSGVLGNFSTYSNPVYNITIDYPQKWEYKENPSGNTVVAFRSPALEIPHIHAVGLSISVDNLFFEVPLNKSSIKNPSFTKLIHNKSIENDTLFVKLPWNLTLDEYTKYRIGTMEANYSDVKSTKSTLAGNNAYNASYTFSREDPNTKEKKDFRVMQVWMINKDKAYTITYITEKARDSTYFPVIQ
jgi:hypothetical protein